MDSINTMKEKAKLFLEDKEFEKVKEFCNQILEANHTDSDAYLLKLLCDLQATSENQLISQFDLFNKNINYIKAYQFATEENRQKLLSYRRKQAEYLFADCEFKQALLCCESLTNEQIDIGNLADTIKQVMREEKEEKAIIIRKNIKKVSLDKLKEHSDAVRLMVAVSHPKYFSINNNCIIEKSTKTLLFGLSDCAIPNDGSVTAIGECAFYCQKMESFIIPAQIKKIGDYAFCHCKQLETIHIEEGVEELGSYVFFCCDSLHQVKLPDSLIHIGEDVFHNCRGLTYLEIGKNVASIGKYFIHDCNSLTDIKIAKENKTYRTDSFCIIDNRSAAIVAGCNSSKIPNDGSIKIIGDDAFSGCDQLTEIEIPDGVIELGNNAFQGCDGLSKIIIPDTVKKIGKDTFNHCCRLKKIYVPLSVESVGPLAFTTGVSVTIYYAGKKTYSGVPKGWDKNWKYPSWASPRERKIVDKTIKLKYWKKPQIVKN